MATKKQKDQLIEILKFTPRNYRIELGAYGGECYFGRVDRKIYDFFKQHRIDLEEYASGWDEEAWDFVPEEMRPFPPGSPYECDNLIHGSGATLDSSNYVTVYDENGDEVWQCELDVGVLEDAGVEVNCWESETIEDHPDGTVIFWGGQGEKGLLFGNEFELRAPFDPKKLKLNYTDADGWCIVNGVEYNGEDIDNYSYSTTGKWGENKWIIVGDTEEVYEGVSREDMDEEEGEQVENVEFATFDGFKTLADIIANKRDDRTSDEELQELRNREEWNDVDTKPPAKGEYEVKFAKGEWPIGNIRSAEWTGRSWKENGKKAPEMLGWRELDA